MFKNALISTANKEGLVDFVRPLAGQGMRVVSTGGTARLLQSSGISVTTVTKQTHSPEVMEGRVKSLHPRIYIPLLAREKDKALLKKMHLMPYDLLVCNLYPFEEVLAKAKHPIKDIQKFIEWIDVGGPSLLRAGAKNFKYVTVVCDPADYQTILREGPPDLEKRKALAGKVFQLLTRYNNSIATHMTTKKTLMESKSFYLSGRQVKCLRYGENPDQRARWFASHATGLHNATLHQGKELSFNNLRDLDKAVQTLREFKLPTAIAIKHTNPCGAASDDHLDSAVHKTLKADPESVFGGVVAINRQVQKNTAERLCSLFLEAVIAPSYTADALAVFKRKKNCRVLKWQALQKEPQESLSLHSVSGGFLIQDTPQSMQTWPKDWKITGTPPAAVIKADLLMAWKISRHLKSNAIALVARRQSVGLGMGQVSRIRAVRQAIAAWQQFHPSTSSPVMASDGFFPFADSVEVAAKAGIRWIIQPGGSIRDSEVIASAKKMNINMVLTGKRGFSH